MVGVRGHADVETINDVETIYDVGDMTAPGPVEAGDVVASTEVVYRVEVVLVLSFDARVVPSRAAHRPLFTRVVAVRVGG